MVRILLAMIMLAALAACHSATDFADDDDLVCQRMNWHRGDPQYAACRAALYHEHERDINNHTAAALMILGQGVQNAGQAYAAQPRYMMPTTSMTHCYQVGPSINCQQW